MADQERVEDRSDDELEYAYANNTAIDATVWDIKILFGEYSARASKTDWHTSVTLPWAAAKLLALYLLSNIAVFEIAHEKVNIPQAMIPEPPPPPPEPNERDLEIHKRVLEVRKQVLGL